MGRGEGAVGLTTPTRGCSRAQGLYDELPLKLELYSEELRGEALEALEGIIAAGPPPASAPPQPRRPESELETLPTEAPRLMTIFGKPHAGKDVVPDYLTERYGSIERMAFSDVILLEVNEFLAPHGLRITPETKSEPQNRLFLQVWGIGRRIEDSEYWTRKVRARVERFWSEGTRMVIVTGARVPVIDGKPDTADLEFVRKLGGEIWRVDRPGNPYQAEHAVEQGLELLPDELFDRVVLNAVEGDLEAFHQNVAATLAGEPQPNR